jgi:elongation factor G
VQGYPSDRIRNVLLAGHGGTGKTTLGEALLFLSGAITRPGRVEDGTTVLDFEDEEKAKGLSVSLAVAPIEWAEHKINLLDAPGYADFIGEVQAGLAVCDAVCLVVSAVEGVQVQHEIIWQMAADADLPRLVFVNKADRERADVPGTITALTSTFGTSVAPLQLPIGAEHDFAGVVDLLSGRAHVYEGDQPVETDPPADVESDAANLRSALVEAIVESDDSLMERYLADDTIEPAELIAALGKGVAAGEVFPVAVGSATQRIGVDRLADLFVGLLPSPLERPGMRTPDGEIEDAPSGSPAAYVYKTYADPFVGHISYLRTARGAVRPDIHLYNQRTNQDERLHQLFCLRGKEHLTVPELVYGDLGAVAKLSNTSTGDTLAEKGAGLHIVGPVPMEPVLAVAISPRTKGDEDKLATALHRIVDEDQTVRVERNADTHQTLLWGMGETHLGIVLDRMSRKFGVEVETSEPKVAYRETASKSSDFEGKHKKQSGGRGQYGVAHVRLDPLPRGAGYEFVDAVVGGVIPRQFIPAVDKGIQEAMRKGPLAGYPVVDIRVTVDDGKHHSVDSDEHSFKMAGSLALQGAMAAAAPVLLEPIGLLEVIVPDSLAGDVSGDLNSRRGRLQGMESLPGGRQLIRAMVPMAEVHRYAIDLRSMTGGRGTFSLQFDHYDQAPPQVTDKVVAAAKAES